MNSDSTEAASVTAFLKHSAFRERGAVVADLDGTAVHEREGRPFISQTVEAGLAAIHAGGRQVLVNTLRFPLSVIRVFGAEWHRITGAPIPLVSLNGSQVGILRPGAADTLEFEEIDAFPLEAEEIRELMQGVRGMVSNGADDLLVFFYPRDWREGELIWSPREDHTEAIAAKYRSASRVFSASTTVLEAELLARPICMVFLLIDAPEDRLMAYQHTEKTRFVTHSGVDKRYGAEALARHLGVSLADSIGAGDAPTDTFLKAVGLAIVVGRPDLEYKGLADTVHVSDPMAFGHMLLHAATALK